MQSKIVEEVSKRSRKVIDPAAFISGKSLAKIQRNLSQADLRINSIHYATLALVASAFAGATSLLAGLYFISEPAYAVALAILCFAAAFLALLKYPEARKKSRASEIERELSIALRTIAVELRCNTPFEKTLRNLAKSKYPLLAAEAKRILSEIELGGKTPPEALKEFSDRVDSLIVRRAVVQLVFSYEHGLQTEGIKKLADELVNLQKIRSQQYASQMAFLGLMFIAVSCIIPALFAAYVIVGSSFLDSSFTNVDILLAFVIVFPLVDIALLAYMRMQAPKILVVA
ncbi:TPA: type II secretion system F family protein [Candidatus Micrarchaeota archaeon]|nr:type II secretion system F family protein [Candidatus Micrarchaeota archaeon]